MDKCSSMKMTLLKPYTHASESHPPCAHMDLNKSLDQCLIAQGVAQDIDAMGSTQTKSHALTPKGDSSWLISLDRGTYMSVPEIVREIRRD
ncbi:hypothetical protein [Candidatus Williamhamiltonella defendens]|uniref:hypothetical protein n=1 Tax=Candidatus Williamhamiltonella defendens TaxID=138072 RepID=UPI00130D83B1|nr:hypothetical protein [Candidatus Hamiltonella defensa]